ncbi:MAG: hypothetical protein V8Q84_07560 [Bilophila sp.]
MIFQQRKRTATACRRISILLLAAVFAFSLLCGTIGRVSAPTATLYDAAGVLCELQRDAPALTEGNDESSSVQIVLEGFLLVLCFMAYVGLPLASPTALPARAFATPRRADFWGLIPSPSLLPASPSRLAWSRPFRRGGKGRPASFVSAFPQ